MRLLYSFLIFILFNNAAFSQISISSPLNRAVYQRNQNNTATLDISGSLGFSTVTSVQVRLLHYTNNAVVSGFNWTIIQNNPSKGFYQGKLNNVPGGWYRLEVRAVKSGQVLGIQSLERVGIGDVYMIAGQSNAQGFVDGPPDYNFVGQGSNDERVVTHPIQLYCRDWAIPYPYFEQIQDLSKIALSGNAAWLWGKLGEKLVEASNVPVAFFNTAASGSSTKNWVESANGLMTIHPFTGLPFCASEVDENGGLPYDTVGMPYANFKRGLNFYNSMFGAKSVLWHQGESDKSEGVSQSEYASNLNFIINKSRSDYNSSLPWMVAKASYIDGAGSSAIISAQESVVNVPNKIFGGPYTDAMNNNTMPGSRDWIDLHFSKAIGFQHVIEGWEWFINGSGFMNDATPIPANPKPEILASVNVSNQVILSVPSGYSSYKWIRTDITDNHTYEGTSSEGASSSLTRSSGTYRCWVVASNGNLQVSAPINVNAVLSLSQNNVACTGDVFVSDLKYVSAINGLGPVEIDKTNGGSDDGDGTGLLFKGNFYSKGLGVFGNSQVEYNLPADMYYKFQAKVGIDEAVSSSCTSYGLVFKVIADGETIYTSPVLTKSSLIENIDISILGKKRIILKTETVGASSCNVGIWADAKIKCILGDTEPPSVPLDLVVSDTLTKCLNFTWSASTDDIGVAGYEVLKNGVVVATLPSSTLSYYLKGLTPSQSVSFGVRAFDAAGNRSDAAVLTVTPPSINVAYLGAYAFCVSQSYLPTVHVPKGGVFNLAAGTGATVDPATGAFYSDNLAVNYSVGYTVGASVDGCLDYTSIAVGTTSKPEAPVVTTQNKIVNQGASVVLESTACQAGSTLVWSAGGGASLSIAVTPSADSIYFAECKKDNSMCLVKSNEVSVKVIPNCYSSLSLVNPTDNISGNSATVKFNASGEFNASNKLTPINNIEYNSAKSVTLSPGFTVEPGVVFKAEIKNCP